MKVLKEYWEAALKLHTTRPSSFLFLLAGLTFVALTFEVEDLRASVANALLAMFVLYLYVDSVRLQVHIQRDLRQRFIKSLDD